tara:strand:+ start:4314 stop:5720 length:1407 start_codon:yes stop_codon:yes gene_type:complete
MRITLLAILICFSFLKSHAVIAADYLQMLNSYVSVKLHLDSDPKRGQMVGAAWIRIRNNTDAPVSDIPYILNPGLQVTKVLGGNNRPLNNTSRTLPIEGYEFLETTVGTIGLPTPVKPDSDIEVVIHFRGSLQNLSWAGIEHAKEELDKRFTILRADSFGYPIISAPTKAAINAALNQPPYYQTATIEMADGYMIAGNLHIDEVTLKGANQSFSLSYTNPSTPMILPIARYQQITEGPLVVSVLEGEQTAGATLISTLSPDLVRLNNLLGAPTSGKLNITMVPDGYGTLNTPGLVMLEQGGFTTTSVKPSGTLLNLWGIGTQHPKGHWRNSLDKVIQLSVSGEGLDAHTNTAFSDLKAALSTNKKLGKATLESLTEAGSTGSAELLSSMVLIGLHDIMGPDAFFAFIRELRSELRGNYADNIAFSEFIADNLKHKKAKKFAKNWLTGKKIGKDMKKSDSFSALIKRYK